jgi:hypothetical protein
MLYVQQISFTSAIFCMNLACANIQFARINKPFPFLRLLADYILHEALALDTGGTRAKTGVARSRIIFRDGARAEAASKS